MKVIIAGGRDITNPDLVELAVRQSGFSITEVVSGRAPGVDTLGERWARMNKIPITPFPADWKKYGKPAGPIRNTQMANYAEALIAIWDGKSSGTKDMINQAQAKGLAVFIYRV